MTKWLGNQIDLAVKLPCAAPAEDDVLAVGAARAGAWQKVQDANVTPTRSLVDINVVDASKLINLSAGASGFVGALEKPLVSSAGTWTAAEVPEAGTVTGQGALATANGVDPTTIFDDALHSNLLEMVRLAGVTFTAADTGTETAAFVTVANDALSGWVNGTGVFAQAAGDDYSVRYGWIDIAVSATVVQTGATPPSNPDPAKVTLLWAMDEDPQTAQNITWLPPALAAGSVDTAALADGAVTNAKIAARTITDGKLAAPIHLEAHRQASLSTSGSGTTVIVWDTTTIDTNSAMNTLTGEWTVAETADYALSMHASINGPVDGTGFLLILQIDGSNKKVWRTQAAGTAYVALNPAIAIRLSAGGVVTWAYQHPNVEPFFVGIAHFWFHATKIRG